MIVVIFEVEPASGKKAKYLDVAASLKPHLEKVDGFISLERFQSLTNEGKILSLSFFRDEEAVQSWRCTTNHRHAQTCGRNEVFQNYRLRVAEVLRDYAMQDRNQVPEDSKALHDTSQT